MAWGLAALLVAGAWWVWSVAPREPSDSGAFDVFVVAPDGSTWANGTVIATNATALSVLELLAAQQGFGLDVEFQGGFGVGCAGAYVRGIGDIAETRSGGWNYYTRGAGGDWTWQAESAACHGLQAGEQVEWCWVEADVCENHVAGLAGSSPAMDGEPPKAMDLQARKADAVAAALQWMAGNLTGAYAAEAAHAAGLDTLAWPSRGNPLLDSVPLDLTGTAALRPHLALATSGYPVAALPLHNGPVDVLQRIRDTQPAAMSASSDVAQSFQILGLIAAGVLANDTDVQDLKDALLAKQDHVSGGWGCGGAANTDCTGFAVAALLASDALDQIDGSARGALQGFLDSARNADDGYGTAAGERSNAQSTVWALTAQAHLGRPIPAASWEFLLGLQRPDGAFECFVDGTPCAVGLATAETIVALSGFHPIQSGGPRSAPVQQ